MIRSGKCQAGHQVTKSHSGHAHHPPQTQGHPKFGRFDAGLSLLLMLLWEIFISILHGLSSTNTVSSHILFKIHSDKKSPVVFITSS